MGQQEREREERKKERRGSVNNGKRLEALVSQRSGNKVDWGDVDPRWFGAIVVLITTHGGAVRFGCSQDGGAYSVGLYLGSEVQTLWFNGNSDIQAEVEALYNQLVGLLGE